MPKRIYNPKRIRTEIYVPALMDGDNIIVPQIWLGADLGYRKEYGRGGGNPLSAINYQQLNPPTLAELRHAFFDKHPDGSWISPEYRQSVLSKREREYGEWTSTFLRDGKEIVERPERVFYDKKHDLWIAEGGKISPIELQPDGWVLEYDKLTGFPSRTSGKRKDAEKIFGDDASYFLSSGNGLRAVLRYFSLDDGPFFVYAGYEPGDGDLEFGARPCRRSEQDVNRLATPMYLMG